MSEPSSVSARMKRRAVAATVTAGLIAGILDIIAAFLVYGRFGAQPERILQGIASGILGSSAFDGGSKTAVLGLALHFLIALGAAVVFYVASRKLKFLTRHAFISGLLFGIAVYFFMQNVVLPLSAYHRGGFSASLMFIGVVIHIFCVGLPISLTIRRFPI
jgi:phosphoglycerol transferase MdoB-like AlkP superfamily enzyme